MPTMIFWVKAAACVDVEWTCVSSSEAIFRSSTLTSWPSAKTTGDGRLATFLFNPKSERGISGDGHVPGPLARWATEGRHPSRHGPSQRTDFQSGLGDSETG